MKRAHCETHRASSWLAGRTGAWIIGLAVVWLAASPRPAWGQFNGTNPVWTYSNVGIGTTSPWSPLQVASGGSWNVDPDILTVLHASTDQYMALGMDGPAGLITAQYGLLLGVALSGESGFADGSIRFTPASGASVLFTQGNVGIGTSNPQHLLHVAGTIGAEEVIVTSSGADYVFQPGYRLQPLTEVAQYIRQNHHLPDIPSEAEVKQNGLGVGDMQAKLLAKVEELTLHMIQAEQENQELRKRIARLETDPGSTAPEPKARQEKEAQ